MTDPTASKTAYLGLGSNLGDRLAAMRAAVLALDEHLRISVDLPRAVASLYESAAVVPDPAADAQPPYLNSAIRVETSLLPMELLRVTLEVEASLGRVRRRRWEARIIDIDLLLYDGFVLHDGCLTLPHPRLHERRFVLEPLAEIAGDLLHPTLHATIAHLARELASGTGNDLTRLADPQWVHVPDLPGSQAPTFR